jgi:hypothetical protein
VSFTFANPVPFGDIGRRAVAGTDRAAGVHLARFVALAVPDRIIALLQDLVEAPT